MKPDNTWRPLPHEIFFGLFLVVTWTRLGFAVGFLDSDALFYFALIVLNIFAFWFCRWKDTPMSWQWGMLFYPIAMSVIFMELKSAVPKIHPAKMDGLLQQIDASTMGTTLSVRLQSFAHPALTEFFSFCYMLFFPYLFFSMVYYFCGDVASLKKFVIGLFSIYGIGFLGYSFVPAIGPYRALADQFTAPLNGWWLTHLNAALVVRGTNDVDVFPSLHCAVTSFFLLFDREHRPWRFKLYLIPCVGLWISTIYLRYHYLVDVACGFMLSALALWLANQFSEKQEFNTAVQRKIMTPSPTIP